MLNSGKFPSYLNCGRMIPISKRRDSDTVGVEDIRPIVIRSHLTKIVEKTILKKIHRDHPHLLNTRGY